MPGAQKGNPIVLVGTRKGAFFFSSNRSRRAWKVHGPFFKGIPINHVVYDGRSNRIYAAVNSEQWGPAWLGQSIWERTGTGPRSPHDSKSTRGFPSNESGTSGRAAHTKTAHFT